MKNWRKLGIAGLTGILGAAGLWGANQSPRGDVIHLNPPPPVTATLAETAVEVTDVPEPTSHDVPESAVSAVGHPDCAVVNINTANQEELETLKGIGPVLAERIIAYRDENGDFRFIEHIQDVSGIGPMTFEDIQPCITVGDEEPQD